MQRQKRKSQNRKRVNLTLFFNLGLADNDYKTRAKLEHCYKMVVMVTCKHCGFEYQSKVLQTPDEDSLIYEPREGVMENCPKCNQTSSHVAADFYWINPLELESQLNKDQVFNLRYFMIILSVLISLVKELVQPLTIYPHERINRILKIIEEKQNGRCISCKQHITNKHVVVSSGRPRSYYHKDCAVKHHMIRPN